MYTAMLASPSTQPTSVTSSEAHPSLSPYLLNWQLTEEKQVWEARNGFISDELGWKEIYQQRSRGLTCSKRKPSFSRVWSLVPHSAWLPQPTRLTGKAPTQPLRSLSTHIPRPADQILAGGGICSLTGSPGNQVETNI